MANTLNGFGMMPIGPNGGAAPTFELMTVKVASTDTNKIYFQDPVKALSNGYVGRWTNGTRGDLLVGVFRSCKYYSTSQGRIINSPYWPGTDATGDVTAYLVPVKGSVPYQFVIQCDSTALAQADINANADLTMTAGATTGACFSGATLAYASLNTTATLPLNIVSLYSDLNPVAPNGADNTTSYNWAVVRVNPYNAQGV